MIEPLLRERPLGASNALHYGRGVRGSETQCIEHIPRLQEPRHESGAEGIPRPGLVQHLHVLDYADAVQICAVERHRALLVFCHYGDTVPAYAEKGLHEL